MSNDGIYALLLFCFLGFFNNSNAETPAQKITFKSQGFLKLPSDITLGAVSAVAIDQQDLVYVLQRGTPPLLAWDEQGNYSHGWGDKLFKVPHGLRIDHQGQLWTTDNALHVVQVFTRRGELVKTIKEIKLPDGKATTLKAPDDLVFDTDHNIYIADAGNGRIVKLDAAGNYVAHWGKKGKGDGEFATAHSLAIDPQNRIFVGDRGNKRVQVFDSSGKYLASWQGGGNPFGMIWLKEQLIASEGDAHQLMAYDQAGKYLGSWGDKTTLELPHLLAVNSKHLLYVAEVNGKRVQIFSYSAE
jgi:DNA-binding beta-propeller fold protein YncE